MKKILIVLIAFLSYSAVQSQTHLKVGFKENSKTEVEVYVEAVGGDVQGDYINQVEFFIRYPEASGDLFDFSSTFGKGDAFTQLAIAQRGETTSNGMITNYFSSAPTNDANPFTFAEGTQVTLTTLTLNDVPLFRLPPDASALGLELVHDGNTFESYISIIDDAGNGLDGGFFGLPVFTGDGATTGNPQTAPLQNILPVELTYFRASKLDETFSNLTWETSSEINNDYFDVERSANGQVFEKIGNVIGNGTTNETQNYEFLDRAPLAGLNYYRLKQVDFNGEYEYSKIETVDFRDGTEGDIKVFPNPAVDFVNISLDRKYEVVRVTNQLGQLVQTFTSTDFEENNLKINVVGYTPGVYFIEAKLGAETVNKQFVTVK